jgi:hypothetical protein
MTAGAATVICGEAVRASKRGGAGGASTITTSASSPPRSRAFPDLFLTFGSIFFAGRPAAVLTSLNSSPMRVWQHAIVICASPLTCSSLPQHRPLLSHSAPDGDWDARKSPCFLSVRAGGTREGHSPMPQHLVTMLHLLYTTKQSLGRFSPAFCYNVTFARRLGLNACFEKPAS